MWEELAFFLSDVVPSLKRRFFPPIGKNRQILYDIFSFLAAHM